MPTLPYDVARHICRRHNIGAYAMGPEYQWGDPRDPRLVVILQENDHSLVGELETDDNILVGYTDDSAPCACCGCIVDTVPTSLWWRPDFVDTRDGERHCMNCVDWSDLLGEPSACSALAVRQIVVSRPPTPRTLIAAGYWPTTLDRPPGLTDIGDGVVVLHGDEWVVYLPAGDARLDDYGVWHDSAPCDSIDLETIARTLFVDAFADGCENGEFGANINASGCDWLAIAPETDPSAIRMARKVVCDWISSNSLADNMDDIFTRLLKAGVDTDKDWVREAILHGATMSAMGHGVSWTDDHPNLDAGVFVTESPNAEFEWADYSFDREYDENGDVVEVEGEGE